MATNEQKTCQNCKNRFIIEPADFQFYEKIGVPPPTFCPECRLVRRLAWRNERTLYHQTCALCGAKVISVFSPETDLSVYCGACWWSDKWDGMRYGVDYDPSRPFFPQLYDLFERVPAMNLYRIDTTAVNSDYVNMTTYVKDCYLCTYIDYSERCCYSSFVVRSKDSVDCLMLQNSELCYESVNCHKCFRTFWSRDCEGCYNMWYSRNCVGCSNCFGCVNLVNKNYHIFNRPYSKEEYAKALETFRHENPRKLWDLFPQKYMHGRHNTDVSGEYIYNSKNTRDSYLAWNLEDCRFCAFADNLKDSYDFINYGDKSELFYECLQCGDQCSRIRFSWWVCSGNSDVDYSMYSIGCSNIFGCAGVKKKEYCILNKQYTKEEYERLKNRIMRQMEKDGEYGQFFPIALSPFGYNETTAQEFFPLTKEEAIEKGYAWRDPSERNYQITIESKVLPEQISDVKDSILNDVIGCAHEGKCNEQCTTAFRIIPQELEFYRKMNLPLPRLCPNCRHYQRIKQRNPLKLWHRKCTCAGAQSENGIYKNTATHRHGSNHCPEEFETSYAPDRKEIVYCEQCYQTEVV